MTTDQNLLLGAAMLVVMLFTSIVWLMRTQQRHTERQSEQSAKQSADSAMMIARLFESEQRRHADESSKAKEDVNKAQGPSVGVESGGYIIVDLPESKKGMFQDLLRGFEDYARLLGYSIRVHVKGFASRGRRGAILR